jgi:hypothetical protein
MTPINPAELLLLSTGAIALPTATDIKAIRKLPKELEGRLHHALEREKPAKLVALTTTKTFWPRLAAYNPDYASMDEVEDTFGLETCAKFQALQLNARNELERRHPVTLIDTVLGPRPVPSSYLDEETFRVLADTVQDETRLLRDMASGVVIRDQVILFAACFPETYTSLLTEMSDWLIKQEAANPEWLPPLWLADQIKLLRQEKLDTGISMTITAGTSKGSKAGLDPKPFKANSDLTL